MPKTCCTQQRAPGQRKAALAIVAAWYTGTVNCAALASTISRTNGRLPK